MKIKKLICTALACLMLMSCFSAVSMAENDTALQFGDDGKFTILNLSDIQDGIFLSEGSKYHIRAALDYVKPDLVVLTGDNIAGSNVKTKKQLEYALDGFMSIFEEYGVKVAAVFGNHDDESKYSTKERQMELYKSYSCFVGTEGEELTGCGTYNLPILSSDGTRTAFNLWFTDSGTYDDEGGYAATEKDQIQWYKDTAAALKAENGGETVYSINFQHIIVPEIYDALKVVDKGTEGAVQNNNSKVKEYYLLPEGAEGELLEPPCPPFFTNGQFDAMVETGDILATVSGHDHMNTFKVNYKGIDILNTPAAGFGAYHTYNLGSRVFVLDENNPKDYETYCLTFEDVAGDDEKGKEIYSLYSDYAYKSHNVFKKLSCLIMRFYNDILKNLKDYIRS